MRKRLWAGLDVGVETTTVCIVNDSGEVVHQATCPTILKSVHRELACLRRLKFARVALEAATGMTLARGLRRLGYEVDIFEQRQLAKFLRLRRNKTDEGDAAGIAEAGRLGAATISKVHLKTLESQQLQSRLTIRRHLMRQRIAVANILGRQLEQYGGRLKRTGPRLFRSNAQAEIRRVFPNAPNELRREICYLVDHCQELIDHQRTVDAELNRIAIESSVCRRFMEIPGVGALCALTFYAAVSDPSRFAHSTDIGSYLGLTPTVWQSGLMYKVGKISKMGNTAARTMLVTASQSFLRWSEPESDLRVWATAIEQRRGRRKAVVALARKLAVTMLAMWKSGDVYRPRRPALVSM